MRGERWKTAAVTTGLATWLVVTAAGQLPDTRFDGLLGKGAWRIPVPNWRFFGPNPGTKDVHLLYRDVSASGATPWEQVPVTGDRPWYALVWNARNRSPKALFDSLQSITTFAATVRGDLDRIEKSFGYGFLAEYVREHLPHDPVAEATQFLLMESFPSRGDDLEIIPVFASREIGLDDVKRELCE
ncbi:hypothetical protein [Amycolatopsis sp. CA-230715]|uniref:hypothetical protein n=1 Tax=Amycolatopsis sp. CA-230715 TaxID=2745196 RepID=UPI001C031202|nr:hypothetical protein [Amycolatopsis sp. CA-230715]QWF82691.1 hypothetical protein HUW46_06130 [Amycolatopsis sp. CA-230715]